jgi:ribosomal protein S18 acetylase RimI-like enzyme
MHEFLAWAATTGAREARLRVADGNDAARKLYERHGFRETGTREAGTRGMVEVEMVRPAETPE